MYFWFFTFYWNVEFFEYLVELTKRHESFEFDEIAVGFALVAVGIIFDLRLNQRRRELQVEIAQQRLRVLKSTMRTVHDIVGVSRGVSPHWSRKTSTGA